MHSELEFQCIYMIMVPSAAINNQIIGRFECPDGQKLGPSTSPPTRITDALRAPTIQWSQTGDGSNAVGGASQKWSLEDHQMQSLENLECFQCWSFNFHSAKMLSKPFSSLIMLRTSPAHDYGHEIKKCFHQIDMRLTLFANMTLGSEVTGTVVLPSHSWIYMTFLLASGSTQVLIQSLMNLCQLFVLKEAAFVNLHRFGLR